MADLRKAGDPNPNPNPNPNPTPNPNPNPNPNQELKDACHLNLASCQLQLEDWAAVALECDVVLERGANRKALFRRGQVNLTLT